MAAGQTSQDTRALYRGLAYQLLAWGHVAAKSVMDLFNSEELVAPVNNIVFRSDRSGGVQFVMLDGSVHFISNDSERRVRNALVTRSGGEIEAAVDEYMGAARKVSSCSARSG